MKPAYSSDFAKGSLFPGGRRQKAARNFTLWGIPCLIPAVYRFPEGIVFAPFLFSWRGAKSCGIFMKPTAL